MKNSKGNIQRKEEPTIKFGDIGVVTMKNKIQNKLKDRGTTMMFVGFAKDHSTGVFRLYNFETGKVIILRNVIWLKKLFGEHFKVTTDKEEEKGIIYEDKIDDEITINKSKDKTDEKGSKKKWKSTHQESK